MVENPGKSLLKIFLRAWIRMNGWVDGMKERRQRTFKLKKEAISESWQFLNKIEKPYFKVLAQTLITKNVKDQAV